MKYYVWLLVFCLNCFAAVGAELSEDELKDLRKSIKIGSVRDNTIRGDDDKKSEVVKFFTYQNEDDPFEFRMKIVAEMTDKSKNTHYTQVARLQGEVDTEYTGEDNWRFILPHGELDRPRLTAYVIQYGYMNGTNFVVLAEEFDGVDSLEELMERTSTLLEQKAVIKHQYNYRSLDGAEEEEDDDDGDGILVSQWN